MNFSLKKRFMATLLSCTFLAASFSAHAGEKTIEEFKFVEQYSGKNAAYIIEHLGEPDSRISRENEGGTVKLWVYKDLVKIGKTDKTYKYTQIGIVNDAVETLGNTNREIK